MRSASLMSSTAGLATAVAAGEPRSPRAAPASSTSRCRATASAPTPPAAPASSAASSTTCNLINTRDGGVNGVKLTWSECETEYEVERGVECYERLKKGLNGAPPPRNPLSVGIAYAMIDRQHRRQDPADHHQPRPHRLDRRPRLPLHLPAAAQPLQRDLRHHQLHRRARGRRRQARGQEDRHALPRLALRQGDHPDLRPARQEVRLRDQQIEVPHPGNEQQSQWLNIRRIKPDCVILRGWGVMNPVALKTAQQDRLPGRPHHRQRLVQLRGGRAPGRRRRPRATSPSPPSRRARNFPVLQEIEKHVDRRRARATSRTRSGSAAVYYNLGIVNGILNVEAVRIAQAKFGNRTLTGEEVRWGFENLDIDDKRARASSARSACSSRSSCPATTTRATAP